MSLHATKATDTLSLDEKEDSCMIQVILTLLHFGFYIESVNLQTLDLLHFPAEGVENLPNSYAWIANFFGAQVDISRPSFTIHLENFTVCSGNSRPDTLDSG